MMKYAFTMSVYHNISTFVASSFPFFLQVVARYLTHPWIILVIVPRQGAEERTDQQQQKD
jgi:hypothetical protein